MSLGEKVVEMVLANAYLDLYERTGKGEYLEAAKEYAGEK